MNQRNLLRMAVMLAFMPFRGQVVAQPLTWSLAPSAPEVTDITHGAIGDRFFTETHSSTPGTVSINVVTNNKTTGIGTITITAPASVTGTLDEAKGNLNLSTAAAFTIRSSISNTTFNQVTAFTQDGTRTAQTASLSFNVNTLAATTSGGPLNAFLAVWVDFTLPLFPDAPNLGSYSYIRYKVLFKWLVTPVCPALAAASAVCTLWAPAA